MVESAAQVVPPRGRPGDEERQAGPAAGSRVAQSPADLGLAEQAEDADAVGSTRGPDRATLPAGAFGRSDRKTGVLVVDDDPAVRNVLRAGLEHYGFRVWLAADGREAVHLYGQLGEAVAVVLLDVRMPGLDGPQTLEVLRNRGADVLACFMSGDTGGYEPEDLLRRGARYVFAKPFCLGDMANTLRLLADGVPRAPRTPCTEMTE